MRDLMDALVSEERAKVRQTRRSKSKATAPFSVRVPADVLEAFRRACYRGGWKMATVMVRLMKAFAQNPEAMKHLLWENEDKPSGDRVGEEKLL